MALPEPAMSPEMSSPSSLGDLTSSDVSPVKAASGSGSPLKSAYSGADEEDEEVEAEDEEEDEEEAEEDEDEEEDEEDEDEDVEMTIVEPEVSVQPEEETLDDDDEHDEHEEPVCPPGTSFKYPPAVSDFSVLPDRVQRFKKARFTSCTDQGCTCPGLVPPLGAVINLGAAEADEEEEEEEEEAEDLKRWRTPEGYWRECGECGHGWESTRGHVGSMRETAEEGRRKGRVIGRIEELLNVGLPQAPLTTGRLSTADLSHTHERRRAVSHETAPSFPSLTEAAERGHLW